MHGRRIIFRATVCFSPGLLIFVVLAAATASFLRADPPSLDALNPAGGERGTTNAVTAVGKFSTWPSKIWVSGEGVTFNAETNKGKFSVAISAGAQPGPRLVRVHNAEGVSDPRIFVVGSGREQPEIEPNNHFSKAQPIDRLPVTINGRLDKNGDVDSFAIQVHAGEWLDASVESYQLLSKVDAVLRLMTTNGLQLAWNHDFTTLDPRLVWRAPRDLVVVLQLFGFAFPPGSEVALTGGEAVVYRLHIDLTNESPAACLSSTEEEPNDVAAHATRIELPADVNGVIGSAGDEDRVQFTLRQNETIEARLDAAAFGSPLDAWLAIEDLQGNTILRNDDAEGSPDPRVEWKAPTNGTFIVAVGSVTHHGGADYCYRLSLRKAGPDYNAVLGASSIAVTGGMTNDVKLEVTRLRGFTNDLAVAIQGLPDGVQCVTTNVPAKETTASLKLVAATNAAPWQGPVKVVLRDQSTDQERVVPFELTTRGETGFNHLLLETSEDFWLTVRRKAGK